MTSPIKLALASELVGENGVDYREVGTVTKNEETRAIAVGLNWGYVASEGVKTLNNHKLRLNKKLSNRVRSLNRRVIPSFIKCLLYLVRTGGAWYSPVNLRTKPS